MSLPVREGAAQLAAMVRRGGWIFRDARFIAARVTPGSRRSA